MDAFSIDWNPTSNSEAGGQSTEEDVRYAASGESVQTTCTSSRETGDRHTWLHAPTYLGNYGWSDTSPLFQVHSRFYDFCRSHSLSLYRYHDYILPSHSPRSRTRFISVSFLQWVLPRRYHPSFSPTKDLRATGSEDFNTKLWDSFTSNSVVYAVRT